MLRKDKLYMSTVGLIYYISGVVVALIQLLFLAYYFDRKEVLYDEFKYLY